MKQFIKIIATSLFLMALLTSCSTDEENEIVPVDPPTAANLIFPENNKECNEGEIISETETDVLFKWDEATNASSYILSITNLNTGSSREIKTDSNEFLIRILRGTPYSWSVKSRISGSNELAESEIWKFYNAGLPEESHPPFPAEAINPQNGASISEGELTLQWEVTDVDNDIVDSLFYWILLILHYPRLVIQL